MKTKQLFLSLLVLLTSSSAYAYDFEHNGICYKATGQNTVEVTYVENGSGNADFYYGDVIIPQSIVRNGVTYSVTNIGEYAFQGCSGLTSIEIPNSVTSIGSRAFADCSGLTEIVIPNSVTSIGGDAFSWCPSLSSIVVNSGNSTFDSRNDRNAIIETASNKLIVGCKTTVIPNTVTSIGYSAFRGSGLTSIEIPNSVTSIGGWAFAGCSGLTSIVIPNSVTSIGQEAFYNCSSLTSVFVKWNAPLENLQLYRVARNQVTLYVPAGSKTAYEAANYWKDFKEIREFISAISFADGNVKAICVANWDTNGDGELDEDEAAAVTELGSVFRDNANITSFDELRYFTGLTSIGLEAFSGCRGLTSIEIPNSVTRIADSAFSGCSGLTSIVIPNSVTSIGSAFSSCSGLTSIVIPNSVKSIGSHAFSSCSGLTSIVIPNSVTSIGGGAFRGSGLTSIEIPNSVTSIGGWAFAGCSGLTSIVIPNSVTSIGGRAFAGCSGLTEIVIPNSVTSIGEYAFDNCSSLTSVFVKWNAPLENLQLYGVARNQVTLYVPAGSKTAYEAANYWKDFKEIREFISAISFADGNVKAICVANWDTNGDGELDEDEAAAVTELGSVFRYNVNITSFDELRYFTGLTSIGEYAFYGCRGLTSIVIPNSVTRIGSAFSSCSGLTSIVIPNSVTSIGQYAFSDCSGLTSIVVNSGNSTFDSRNDCNAIIETASNKLIVGCKTTVIPNTVTSIGQDAFGGCSGLTSIVIPNSVTSILQDAFGGCSGLTSIVIPNSVTSIVHGAFYRCSGLTSIVVNSGNSTFDSRNDCNAIIETASNKLIVGCKTTVIPNTVTSIGQDAFSGCSGLTSIVIPNSVTSIGICAFYYCSGLTSIVIPNSVTSIGEEAFRSCSGLTSIEIPNSVTTIGNSAFCYCSGLTSIEIPNSVTSIGRSAFADCSGLTSVTVDLKTPLSINMSTFTNRAATLYVPAGCKAAYEAANYWKDFKEIREFISAISFADGNVKAICVANWDTNGDGELDEDEAAAVTELGQVFRDNANITSFDELRYFTGLTSIGQYAFYLCRGLTSIEIPNSVTSIGEYAFAHCSGLTSIVIPNSVKSIGQYAFTSCSGLTSIEIPNSVKSIGQYAFYWCPGLTSIEIPNSVTSIGYRAFGVCSGLTSIVVNSGNSTFDSRNDCNAIIETASNKLIVGCKTTVIPNSVTSIGECAFYGCSGLTSIEIPNSVTRIGYYAFSGCSGLTSIVIPNSVTSIGGWAFDGCRGLTSIEIPNSVTSIGEYAFDGCSGLTSIVIPNSVTSIGDYAFSGCSGLTSIEIPNSVTSIAERAFYNCSGLTSIVVNSGNSTFDSRNDCNAIIETASNKLIVGCKTTVIPNSVTSIGSYAFAHCSGLTEIVIPNSVTSIADYAFYKCSGLTSVTVDLKTPLFINWSTFTIRANATLHVPAGCKAAYEAAEYWKDFKEIVEMTAPDTDITEMDNVIYVEAVDGFAGGTVKLDIKVKNVLSPVGCSFKLTLPDGFTLEKDADGDVVYVLGDRARKMSLTMQDWNNGAYDCALTPTTATAGINGSDGAILTFSVRVPDNATAGEFKMHLTRNLIQTKTEGSVRDNVLPDVQTTLTIHDCIPGDVNDDGSVTPSDAIMILYRYFGVEQSGFKQIAADVNSDNNISPADAIEVLYKYFASTQANAPAMTVDTLDPQ